MLSDQNDESPQILDCHPTYPAKLYCSAEFRFRRSIWTTSGDENVANRVLGLDPSLNSLEETITTKMDFA